MGIMLFFGDTVLTFKLGWPSLLLAIALIGYFWPTDNQALSNEKSPEKGIKDEK